MSRRFPFLHFFLFLTAGILIQPVAFRSWPGVGICAAGAGLCATAVLACELLPGLLKVRANAWWRARGFAALLGFAIFFSGVVSSYCFFSETAGCALSVGPAEIEGDIAGPVEVVRRGRQRRVAFELETLAGGPAPPPPVSRPSGTCQPTRFQRVPRLPARARVQCFLVNPPGSLRSADRVRLAGRLEDPPGARNPGEFDYAAFLRSQGIRYVFRGVGTRSVLGGVRRRPASLAAWFYRMRGMLSTRLARAMRPPEGDLVAALCLGERRGLSPELTADFVRTGLVHVIAVSGFNVWLLAGGLWGALKLCAVPPRMAVAACLATVGGYVFLSGAPVTVVRAAWMAAGAFLAVLLREPAASLNFLFFASFLILFADPGALALPSFQLSFASSLALLTLAPRLDMGSGSGRPRSRKRAARSWRAARWLARQVFSSLSVSAAVLIGAGPVSAWHFHALSLVSVLANLLVLPLFVLAMWCALPGLVSLVAWPPAASVFLEGARVLLGGAVALNGYLARLPGFFPVPKAAWGWLALGCAFLGAYALAGRAGALRALWPVGPGAGRISRLPRPAYLAGAALAVLGGLVFSAAAREQPFSFTVLAARQGFVALARMPGRAPVLFNTGGGRSGRGVFWLTLPYLRSQGVRRLSGLVLHSLSAADAGGLAVLGRQVEVGRVFVPAKDAKRAAAVDPSVGRRMSVYRLRESLQLEPGTGVAQRVAPFAWMFSGRSVRIAVLMSARASGALGLRNQGGCFDAVVLAAGSSGERKGPWASYAKRCPETVMVTADKKGDGGFLRGLGLRSFATSACGMVRLIESPAGQVAVETFLPCSSLHV